MRILIALGVAALVAGCGTSPGPWLDTGVDESMLSEPSPVELALPDFDPSLYESMTTFQLGTELRPKAKTIDWSPGGVAEGTTFMNGQVAVKTVRRQDADDFFGVSLQLVNRGDRAQAVEWMIAFIDGSGKRKIGLNDYRNWEQVYRPAVIEPYGRLRISNSCRMKGAQSFKLYVRAKGDRVVGDPDAGSLEEFLAPAPGPSAAPVPEDDDLLESIGR